MNAFRRLLPEPSVSPAPPLVLERRHWLAALAMLFVLFAPYQTLVQTVITDDAIRKGVQVDDYDMTWVQVTYGVGLLYGVFVSLWLSFQIGARFTIALGLVGFALGNLLCGAADSLETLAFGRFVDGFGKILVMAVGRATLYKQFDRMLLVAIGFYGVFAYSTRYWTPLLQASLLSELSWRWMYWAFIPVGAVGRSCWCGGTSVPGPAPPHPIRLPIDWLAVTLFVAWVIAIVFAFSWYRKWGGWSSNTFVATVICCITLPVVLVGWIWIGLQPRRTFDQDICEPGSTCVAMATRGLMLLHLAAVLTIIGLYATELRNYPRTTVGWLMVPCSVTMAARSARSRRAGFIGMQLRHVWLLVGVVGAAGCIWWLSSARQFHLQGTSGSDPWRVKGAFLGLIPPVFLTDEVEGLNPKDGLYAGALGVVALVVPILTVPTATGTVIKAWSDRAEDTYRLNLSTNRPAVSGGGRRRGELLPAARLKAGRLDSRKTGIVLGRIRQVREHRRGVSHGAAVSQLIDAGHGSGRSTRCCGKPHEI